MMTLKQSTKKSNAIPMIQIVKTGATQIARATITFPKMSPPVTSDTTATIGTTILTGHSSMYQNARNALLSSFSIRGPRQASELALYHGSRKFRSVVVRFDNTDVNNIGHGKKTTDRWFDDVAQGHEARFVDVGGSIPRRRSARTAAMIDKAVGKAGGNEKQSKSKRV